MAYPVQQHQMTDIAGLVALADPTRRVLLDLLRHEPLPVGELARRMPVSRPAVSQHLKILKEALLVREHRRGTKHYFGLNPAGFAELRKYADSMWEESLSAFSAHVGEQGKKALRFSPRAGARKNKKGSVRDE